MDLFGGTDQLHRFEPTREFGPQRLLGLSGQMRAYTEMFADPESEMSVGSPIDPEFEGIFEDFLVPIRGCVEEGEIVAVTNRLAPKS